MHRPHPGQRHLRKLIRDPTVKVVVSVHGRRWGKTTGWLEGITETGIDRPQRFGWFAHQANAVRVAYEKLLACAPASAIAEKHKTPYHMVRFINGTVWEMFTAENPDAALGRAYHRVVVDEAARCSKQFREEIVPAFLADYAGQLYLTTTPKGRRGRGGHVYVDYQKAMRGVSGFRFLSGPTWQNPMLAVWKHCRFSLDNLPRAAFLQEFAGQFLDDAARVVDLSTVAINGGTVDLPTSLPYYEDPEGEPCVMGLDLARARDWQVAAVFGRRSGRLRAMERYHQLPWSVQIQRAVNLARDYGCVADCWVDATGVGERVFEELDERGLRVSPIKFTNDITNTLVQGLQLAVERREISMPWIREVMAEAEMFEAIPLPSGRIRYAAAEGSTDDTIFSMGLALHGLQQKPPHEGLREYMQQQLEEREGKAVKRAHRDSEQARFLLAA